MASRSIQSLTMILTVHLKLAETDHIRRVKESFPLLIKSLFCLRLSVEKLDNFSMNNFIYGTDNIVLVVKQCLI